MRNLVRRQRLAQVPTSPPAQTKEGSRQWLDESIEVVSSFFKSNLNSLVRPVECELVDRYSVHTICGGQRRSGRANCKEFKVPLLKYGNKCSR